MCHRMTPMKMRKINYLKWLKLSLAAPLAMVIAKELGLQYATSAATITLLTVQDTRKDTLEISLKRAIGFVVMTLLCVWLFQVMGHETFTYAVFLCLFMLISYWTGLESGITMNAVLASHYLSASEISLSAIGNEASILAIGAGMGMLANLIMPENLKKIRAEQAAIDGAMKGILERMSIYLCREDKSRYTGECFDQVDNLLGEMEREANLRIRNTLTRGDTYFISYMKMRMRQCEVLKSIYSSIMQISAVPIQAKNLSLFLMEISDSFHEKNNVDGLLLRLRAMRAEYKLSDLPATRVEFENRAILMQITRDLERFLLLKREFIEQLTKEEQRKYWGGEEVDRAKEEKKS